MIIRLNLDTKSFKKKPYGAEIGGISNRMRIGSAVKEIETKCLKDYIKQGITFTPAVLEGPHSEDWKEQQLICIDIDNETFKKDENGKYVYEEIDGKRKQVRIPINNQMTPQESLRILRNHNIMPILLYKSFSYTSDWERFRIVILLSEPLRDVERMRNYTHRLANLFTGADKSIGTPERMLFGSTPDCVIYDEPENVTNICDLDRLPTCEKAFQSTSPGILKTSDFVKPITDLKCQLNFVKSTREEMKYRLRQDILTFDLMKFIINTTDARPVRVGNTIYAVPCPVCGRDSNHFHIRGNSWQCYDTNNTTGHRGGTIIDYLIAVYGVRKADAIEKFKYDIMGYDLENEKKAHRASNSTKKHVGHEIILPREEIGLESSENDPKCDILVDFPNEMRQRMDSTKELTEFHEKRGNALESSEKGLDSSKGDERLKLREKREMGLESSENDPKCDILVDFLDKIRSETYKPYETGLSFFDNLLDGGVIKQSLLILMAAPGTGKTSLCQQIAEEMAEHKKTVIYLNLEMSREQMMAKAISYRLAKENKANKSILDILQGYKWSDEEKDVICAEIDEYRRKIYPYLKYNPENIGSNLDNILNYLHEIGERSKRENEQAPVIIVDYLHLISTNRGLDNHELIKQSVKGLKDYAIEYDTFVIGISATNRISNISGKITMESGRDSSNIEYTGDYQLSLNYYEVDKGEVKTTDTNKLAELQRMKWKRMIIRVLKNRMGTPGREAKVYFNASRNIFYGNNDDLPFDNSFDDECILFNEPTPKAGNRR